MKTFQKVTVAISLIALFASCQSGFYTKKVLSKPETRKEVMDKIANDSNMSKEMMVAMMTSNKGTTMTNNHQRMMMQNHESMMKMKGNPGMMQDMMNTMMDMCKNDTTMMAAMCKTMMANPQMMNMMQKMKGEKMNMDKMNVMDTTKAVDLKSHH